jgi:integrase/recombinase XerD
MSLGRLLLRGFGRPKRRILRHTRKSAPKVRSPRKALVRQEQLPLVIQSDVETQKLQASGLLRPDEKLRKSIEAFLLDQRSPHTRRAYGKDLKRFMMFLAGKKTDNPALVIDRSAVINYKESLLSEGLEHTSVDRHLASLRSFFRWLVDDGVMRENPAAGVRFLKPKRLSRTIGFTDDEVRKVLLAPDIHTRAGAMHYAILMILFHCGLRRSEVCALRTSNLGADRGHKVIRLIGKGNAERVVVMVPAVWNAIAHYCRIIRKDMFTDQYLFTPSKNNRSGNLNRSLDPSSIFHIVTKYAKTAGVANRVSPHSCRATAISNARDHNVADRAIQEFAGWASPDMITRYDKRKTSVEGSAAHSINYKSQDRLVPKV